MIPSRPSHLLSRMASSARAFSLAPASVEWVTRSSHSGMIDPKANAVTSAPPVPLRYSSTPKVYSRAAT